MSVKLTWRNKDRLFQKLRRMAPAAEQALEDANEKSALEMQRTAWQFAPMRTGELRARITVMSAGTAIGVGAVPEGAALVVARAPHSHLVEYGTAPHVQGGMFAGSTHPGTVAQPFFWPAYRLLRKRHKGRAQRALRKSIKEATR